MYLFDSYYVYMIIISVSMLRQISAVVEDKL
jgi:hypothetical protein